MQCQRHHNVGTPPTTVCTLYQYSKCTCIHSVSVSVLPQAATGSKQCPSPAEDWNTAPAAGSPSPTAAGPPPSRSACTRQDRHTVGHHFHVSPPHHLSQGMLRGPPVSLITFTHHGLPCMEQCPTHHALMCSVYCSFLYVL